MAALNLITRSPQRDGRSGFVRAKTTVQHHARPLIVRFGAFGDMVLLTPLIGSLSMRYESPIDIVSSGAWTQPLLMGQAGVGELYLVKSRRRPYWTSPDQWSLVRQLRERGTGPVWFLDAHGRGKSLLNRAGIGPEWIVDAKNFPRIAGEHYLEQQARIANATPPALNQEPNRHANTEALGVSLAVPAEARAMLNPWLVEQGLDGRPLLLLQAGNKRTMRRGNRQRMSNTKYWPETHWAAVIKAMTTRHPEHAIVLLGVPSEHGLNEDIRRLTNHPAVINVASSLPIPLLLALMERADGMVSIDTGPAHAAAALGLPIVVLFGMAEPAFYRPWGLSGAPVICLTPPPRAPLTNLPITDVIDAFAQLKLRSDR